MQKHSGRSDLESHQANKAAGAVAQDVPVEPRAGLQPHRNKWLNNRPSKQLQVTYLVP